MSDKRISFTKLNGKNFSSWKFVITRVIKSKKLDNVVFTKVKPEAIAANTEKEIEAQELLASSLEPNIIAKILTCETANDMWERLVSIYQLTGEGNVESLLTNFWKLQMTESEDMSTWIGRIEESATEIRSCGEPLSERVIRARLIGGLSAKYEGFARAWNATTEAERTLQKLIDRLIQDEAELKSREQPTSSNQGTALILKNDSYKKNDFRKKKPFNSNTKEIDKSNSTCNYCNKNGHWAPECHKREFDNRNRDRNFGKKQSGSKNTNDNLAFMAAATSASVEGWYADSGATSHMCKSKNNFTSYQEFKNKRRIILGESLPSLPKVLELSFSTVGYLTVTPSNSRLLTCSTSQTCP